MNRSACRVDPCLSREPPSRIVVQHTGRIVRGRNVRHALRLLMAEVPSATRIGVAAASGDRHDGFGVDDIAWLLRNAPHEVVVLRPDPDRRGRAAAAV